MLLRCGEVIVFSWRHVNIRLFQHGLNASEVSLCVVRQRGHYHRLSVYSRHPHEEYVSVACHSYRICCCSMDSVYYYSYYCSYYCYYLVLLSNDGDGDSDSN